MMKRLLQTYLAVALLLILLPFQAFSDTVTLTILHTTDLHGQVYAETQYDGVVRGGLDRVSALVKKERLENQHVLLVDNGDSIQGNSMAFLFKGSHIIQAMNAMGYDALAIGNHEFNFGPDVLAARMWESNFPWLGANFYRVNPAAGKRWRPVPGSVIREIAGLKVAIVGAFVQDIPNWEQPAYIKNMVFEGVLEATREEVLKVRQEADLVVVLAHTGVRPRGVWRGPGPYDPGSAGEAMAKAIPEMDVLICGHSHRDVAEEFINGVLVTQAGYWGGALGKVTIQLEKPLGGGRAAVIGRKAEIIPVTPDMPQDPGLLEVLKPFEDKWKAWASEKLGEITGELDFRQARVSEPEAVRLIHWAMLEATGADISFHVAFNNSTVLPAGPVTNQDVFDIYFYDNALFVLTLTGRQIKEALEVSARAYNTWNFLTAGGLTWTLDMGRPAGERVAEVMYRGEPLRDDQILKVAVNHYNSVGGGGYSVLQGAIESHVTGKWVREAIADYLRRHSPVQVSELAGPPGLTVLNAPETSEPEPAAAY